MGGAREDDGGSSDRVESEETLKEVLRKSSEEKKVDAESDGKNAAFWTWLWFLCFLCALGFAVVLFAGLSEDEKTGPFAMPGEVRDHFARGKSIKVEIGEQRRSIRVFVRSEGPQDGETVVLLHGMGSSSFIYRKVVQSLASSGMRAIAVDLPGSGLSDKFTMEEWRYELTGIQRFVSRLRRIFNEVLEEGPFWRMERLFQTGKLPEAAELEEKVEIVQWPVGGITSEQGEALEQVLESLGVYQVHLVFHDTSSEAARAWATKHPSRLRSLTIIDSAPGKPSLPIFLLGSPVVGSFILSSKMLFSMLLKSCCIRSVSSEVAEAHAFLLRSGSGRAALLEMARLANSSDTLEVWSDFNVPMQLLWAGSWSKEWKQEGDEQLHSSLPRAKLEFHGGSKWPQEDAPQQVSQSIQDFVSSLPPSEKLSIEEEVPEHIQKMFDDIMSGHEHHHDHDHASCGHSHAAGGGWGL